MQSGNDAPARAPIFLICSERCGSNLISSVLGTHPEVYAHPPYHLGLDLISRLHEVARGGVSSPAWQALKQNAVEQVTRHRGGEEAARLKEWLNQQVEISPGAIARFVFCEMPLEARGKHAFVKENYVHRLLFFFIDCFPDAKFVFQVRDPRDFLASSMARRERWLGNKFGSIRNALHVWREDQVGGLTALGLLGPERVFLQRYEDLVSRFDEVVGGLCAFLGLNFDEGMRKFHEGERSERLAVQGGQWQNLNKPLMTENFRKYRQGLSRGQVKIVEAYVGDLMDRFGYPREYTGPASPSLFSVLKPQITELLERLMNREFRPQYKVGNKRLKAELDARVVPLCPPLW